VEVGSTRVFVFGKVLVVATCVSMRVSVGYASSSVERLMEVTNVVNDKTKGK
jgi:hypothetical protein